MSFDAIKWATQQNISGLDKLVLIILADHADLEDKCWPSINLLAKECGICTKQVRRCVLRLEKLNLVCREKRIRSYGQTSNMYHLNRALTIKYDDLPPGLLVPPPGPLDRHKQSPRTYYPLVSTNQPIGENILIDHITRETRASQ